MPAQIACKRTTFNVAKAETSVIYLIKNENSISRLKMFKLFVTIRLSGELFQTFDTTWPILEASYKPRRKSSRLCHKFWNCLGRVIVARVSLKLGISVKFSICTNKLVSALFEWVLDNIHWISNAWPLKYSAFHQILASMPIRYPPSQRVIFISNASIIKASIFDFY